jgi:hypothetical protein
MKSISDNLRAAAYLLAAIILFQSCIAYSTNYSSAAEASVHKGPFKITTTNDIEYILDWIVEENGNIIGMRNVSRERFNKDEIVQIIIQDTSWITVPLEQTLNYKGTIHLVKMDKRNRYVEREYIEIEEHNGIITGYRMTSADTLTMNIPIVQIAKIQMKDKTKSMLRTIGLITGVGCLIVTIAGLVAWANWEPEWDFGP